MARRAERPKFPNRLREIRTRRGLSLEKLAELVRVSTPTVQRRELGNVKLKVEELELYADALGVEPEQILPSARTVPLVGRVGAGAQIFPNEDYSEGSAIGQVPCPANLDPDRVAAAEVVGDSMFPLETGWILFYARYPEPAAEAVIGHLCVVKVADDGPTLVKQVRRGPERGRFNLLSSNAPMMENVKLEWAARVEAMSPPRDAQRQVRRS